MAVQKNQFCFNLKNGYIYKIFLIGFTKKILLLSQSGIKLSLVE